MKNSTLINQKYKLIRKWKNKIYKLFDDLNDPNRKLDGWDIMFLKDWIKSIQLTKMEIKKLKEKK